METAKQGEKGKSLEADAKGKRTFLNAFMNFLVMGGFLIVMIAIVAIIVLISYLTK